MPVQPEGLRKSTTLVGESAAEDSCPPEKTTDLVGARWRVGRWGFLSTLEDHGNIRRWLAGGPPGIHVYLEIPRKYSALVGGWAAGDSCPP